MLNYEDEQMDIEMSDEQIKRQDFVDNAVFELIRQTNPTMRQISWDIEMIGNIRDSLVSELQKKLGISEFEIYP
jgi:hypothetical protein